MGQVVQVFLGHKDPLDTGLFGSVDLGVESPHGLHLAPQGNLPGHRNILGNGQPLHRADDRSQNGHASGRSIDVPAAHHIHMEIEAAQLFACEGAENRGRVEHAILGHAACRIVEAHLALARLPAGEGHRFNFQDGAHIAADAQAQNAPHFFAGRSLGGNVRAEPGRLDHFLHVFLGDHSFAPAASAPVEGYTQGIGQEAGCPPAFDGVLRGQLRYAWSQLYPQALSCGPDDLHDILGREGIEEHLRTAGAQGRADFGWIPGGGPDEHKIRGCPVGEELVDVLGDVGIVGIVI